MFLYFFEKKRTKRKKFDTKYTVTNKLLEVPIIISIIATCKSTWTVSLKLDH